MSGLTGIDGAGRIARTLGGIVMGGLLFGFSGTLSSAAEPAFVPGEVLVRFKDGTPGILKRDLHSKMGSKKASEARSIGVERIRLAPGLSVAQAVEAYRRDPNVLYAEPNYIRRASVVPNDTSFGQQWGLHNTGQTINTSPTFHGAAGADIHAPEAWDITKGSSSVIVAVIDSGVDYNHPDLVNNIWTNPDDPFDLVDNDGNGYVDDVRGWNFLTISCTIDSNNQCICAFATPSNPEDPMDDYGHGTHVAGIISADGNNGMGIAGVQWAATIMPLKTLDSNGCGVQFDEIRAIDYAISKGARIINASFGGLGSSQAEKDAIQRAGAAGILFVAAAGNQGQDNDREPVFPASFRLGNLVSVAASDFNDKLADFSNYGVNTVDIAAPGHCIYSTTPQGAFNMNGGASCNGTTMIGPNYAFISGTSMAAPHVAGVAGLLLAQDPSLSPDEIRAILVGTADPKPSLKGKVASAGRLDASRALRRTMGTALTGGGGGCGNPAGIIGSDPGGPLPPPMALVYALLIFSPILIPAIRRRWSRRIKWSVGPRRAAAAAVFLSVWGAFSPQASGEALISLNPDENPENIGVTGRPFDALHTLSLKAGYHWYVQSDYFRTNEGLLSGNRLAGWSGEAEYDLRFHPLRSISVTGGHYERGTGLRNLCCSRVEFSTSYLLVTPKIYSRARYLEWYLGLGLGFYHFTKKFTGFIEEDMTANTAGPHVVLGLVWLLHPRYSIFAEGRYALATVKSANAFDDSLDVGGLNVALGFSWHFPRGR